MTLLGHRMGRRVRKHPTVFPECSDQFTFPPAGYQLVPPVPQQHLVRSDLNFRPVQQGYESTSRAFLSTDVLRHLFTGRAFLPAAPLTSAFRVSYPTFCCFSSTAVMHVLWIQFFVVCVGNILSHCVSLIRRPLYVFDEQSFC